MTGYYKTFQGKHGQTILCHKVEQFFKQSPIVMEIQIKINKRDIIKLKSFFTAKKAINKMRRQPTV